VNVSRRRGSDVFEKMAADKSDATERHRLSLRRWDLPFGRELPRPHVLGVRFPFFPAMAALQSRG
jgi:hypothetical protein